MVTERGAGDDEIASAIAAAETAMKEAGIVAVGDICNNFSTLKQKEKGNLQYYNFIEASGWLPSVSEARFERAKALLDVFQLSAKENRELQTRSNCSIVPHAPYSVSTELWRRIQPFFAGKVVSIHNQETVFEDEFFQLGTGDFQRMYELMKIDNSHHLPTKKSSLQSYFNQLSGAEKIILVHNTFTKQEDIAFVNRHSAMGNRQSGKENPEPQTPNPQPQTFFCLC
ncbi:MAG: hypothetical protein EON98_05705, partial [Chitinophagaceae bacterium]